MQNEMELSLLELWVAIKKRIPLILAITIVLSAASFGVSTILPKQYQASTTMLLGLPESYGRSNVESGIRVDDIVLNQKLVGTYREYIKSRTVSEEVIDNLGLEMSYVTFASKLDVGNLKDTEMITIKVTDTIPLRAKDIANETADIFRVKIAEALKIDNIQVVDYAIEPTSPIAPRVKLNTAIGGVLGLMLGVFIAILIELLDTTIKTPEEVENYLGLSVFGIIPDDSKSDLKSGSRNKRRKGVRVFKTIPLESPKSPIAEAFRSLRTNLQFSSIDKEVKSIAFTSTIPREGKSTVAFNLAITMALAGNNILIIDADLRRPSLHKIAGAYNYFGLTNILAEGMDYVEVIRIYKDLENLHIVTSGPVPPNPSELLSSKRMKTFLESMKEYYDAIIIDTPPMGSVTDAAVISTITDGTLMVTASGDVKRDDARRTKEALEKVNANILGVVLNGVRDNKLGYGYYGNYYMEEK